MRDRTSRVRCATVVAVIATSLVLGMAIAAVAAPAKPEMRLLSMLNAVRERHGLQQLRVNVRLSVSAERHTRKMIREDRLYDPRDLAKILRPYADWTRVGASIEACAGTLSGLVRRWMGHAPHRVLILLPELRRAGLGVVLAEGKSMCGADQLWATVIMYG